MLTIRSLATLCALSIFGALTACGTEPSGPPAKAAPVASSVRITAPATTVNGGEMLTLAATVFDQYGEAMTDGPHVTWRVLGRRVVETAATTTQLTVRGEYVGADSVEARIETSQGTRTAKQVLRVTAPLGALTITVRGADSTVPPLLLQIADSAAKRWRQVIVNQLPTTAVSLAATGSGCSGRIGGGVQETVTGLLIIVSVGPVAGGAAVASPCAFHADSAPAVGAITWNAEYALPTTHTSTAQAVMEHEMGHVFGMGTGYRWRTFVDGAMWTGPRAVAMLQAMGTTLQEPGGHILGVPITGGHWGTGLETELMFPVVGTPKLSRLTIAAMQDMGYTVNPYAAEYYNPRDLTAR